MVIFCGQQKQQQQRMATVENKVKVKNSQSADQNHMAISGPPPNLQHVIGRQRAMNGGSVRAHCSSYHHIHQSLFNRRGACFFGERNLNRNVTRSLG